MFRQDRFNKDEKTGGAKELSQRRGGRSGSSSTSLSDSKTEDN